MSSKKVAWSVVLALAIAALIFTVKSCQSEEKPDAAPPTPTPTVSPTPLEQSADPVAARIKKQLDAKSTINTRVDCPAKVVFEPKSDFKCKVYNDDIPDGDALQTVVVTIGENNGTFSWKTKD